MREKCLHGQERGNHVDFKNGSYVDWESIGTLQRVLEFEKQKKKKKKQRVIPEVDGNVFAGMQF